MDFNDSQYASPAPSSDPNRQENGRGTKKHFWIGVLITVLLCAFLVGSVVAGVFGGLYLARVLGSITPGAVPEETSHQNTQPSQDSSSATSEPEAVRTGSRLTVADPSASKTVKSYAEVYAENVASTVGITTAVTTNYFGFRTTSAASGSGFFLTSDGYVLTNYHVIEGATSIKVTTYDDRSFEAELVGYNEPNDIAVLKIEISSADPVTLGHSSNMVVGDLVAAIGNPLGELTFSLTSGVVSAMDRSVTTSSGITMKLLQTDCAINSGNSGGALFNMYGEVIGITNAKYSGSSGSSASIDNIAFAIPIDSVINLISQIVEDGFVLQPYIGISAETVGNAAVRFGYPQGAYVELVDRDGTADKAGIRQGDIITAVGGTEITGKASLISAISSCTVGDTVAFRVFRNGQYLDLSVEIGQKRQSLADGSYSSSYT